MRNYRFILIAIFSLLTTSSMAQFGSDTLFAKNNVLIPLPMVSINFGIGNLMSDVKLNNGPSAFKQFGYQLTISQEVTKFLNASFELFGGTVFGEEQRNSTNLNFKTSLFSQRLSIEYNFFPLLKPDNRGIQTTRPYLGFGLGLLSFRSKGDLKSSNGSTYHYWSDGLIYGEAEGTVDVSEAILLERDFVYETDLRDANLDGLRKYSQLTFSLPINAGIRFQLTKNIGLNAAFSYAFNFSDMLDNVGPAGSEDRQGMKGNDNQLFGSIGLTVYLGTTKPSAKSKRPSAEELAAIAEPNTDTIRQNQKSTKDQAAIDVEVEAKTSAPESNVPQNIANTQLDAANVIPNDGNGRNEKNSQQVDITVDNEPITGNSEQASGIENTNKSNSETELLNSPNVQDDNVAGSVSAIQSSEAQTKDIQIAPEVSPFSIEKLENSKPKKTGNFHWADLDNDGMISPIEVLHFIDLLFEGESERSVEDIQFLIDYYFDQE